MENREEFDARSTFGKNENEKFAKTKNISDSKKIEEIRQNLLQQNPISRLPPLMKFESRGLDFSLKNLRNTSENEKHSEQAWKDRSVKNKSVVGMINNEEREEMDLKNVESCLNKIYLGNEKCCFLEKLSNLVKDNNKSECIKQKETHLDFALSQNKSKAALINENNEEMKNFKNIQLINLIQDLLGYCEVIEINRHKLIEEKNRIRTLNFELADMLKKSNEREQNNFLQNEKQRNLLTKQKMQFDHLKKQAEETVCTLAEQHDLLKTKLQSTDAQLEQLIIENEKLKKAQDLQKIEFQSIEGIREAYAVALSEKQKLQSEVESLRLEFSKLNNEKNILQSEKTHLLSRLDAIEFSQKNSISENNFNFLDLLRKDQLDRRQNKLLSNENIDENKSEYSQEKKVELLSLMSDKEIEDRLCAFKKENAEAQFEHFKALLMNCKDASSKALQFYEYTEILMQMLDK